ncbi:glycosyltransferase family 4 protein [Rhodopirellula sp. JC740]|uniref:Glycosyltransferase family 4 protein n=1 Tax=Rhodopirellula halodulae TaxID=2894198 RepID=A0ABS8NEJ7_9BACT|nr:glycosyltransferase family 4 protein [Rhodopirellula sp. JC740]MCC9641976.1 glycosyltransferase family 4 protein [Rhodopirellula sp. JC740]
MKIGIIGHLKFPIAKPFAGGLEAFTHAYTRALQLRGHDVTLFASGDSDRELPLRSITPAATIPESQSRTGRVCHEWIEGVEDEAYASLMSDLSTSDFDVIHNHSLSPIPLRFAELLPSRLLTTLHAPVLPRMASEIDVRGPEHCGHFVNISKANANAWRRLLPSQTIIRNGVDTNFWVRCQAPKKHRAIWFGRILPDKGTHLALRAAHRAGIPLDVVGPISDEDYFHSEVMPLMQAEDRYLGHRTHEELCGLISQSAVTIVSPCWDEPFGLVVAESLACGTPVAAFRRGAMPELISPSTGRLASPGNVRQLARAITYCMDLPGEVCRRVAQEHLSFDRMVDQYEALYKSQMGSVFPTEVAA